MPQSLLNDNNTIGNSPINTFSTIVTLLMTSFSGEEKRQVIKLVNCKKKTFNDGWFPFFKVKVNSEKEEC